MSMALPCRISVYTENGRTKTGMIKPVAMLAMLSDSPELMAVAQEVEDSTMAMIDRAK